MRIEDERKWTGSLLLRVLAGDVSAEEAIRTIEERCAKDESIIRALHMLCHYHSDSDIRERDTAYGSLQRTAMEAMADRLLQGLPLTREHGYW